MVPATRGRLSASPARRATIVYWMVTPRGTRLRRPEYTPLPPPPAAGPRPPNMTPRCDDTMLRARGECIDTSAGPRRPPRRRNLPENLSGRSRRRPRELIIMREKNTAVVSSPVPLTGPVIYEFHLAHK